MEKITNAVLFCLACAAGLLLFIVGIREIRKKANSKYAMRFLLYLSIVIMALGSFAGCTKVGKQPPGQVWDYSTPQSTQVNLETELGSLYDSLRNACRGAVTPAEPAQLDTALREAHGRVDGLIAKKSITPDLGLYLKNIMTREKERAMSRAENSVMKDDVLMQTAIKDLNDDDMILKSLNAGQRFDSFVARVIKDQVKGSFISMQHLSIEKRLEYGRIGRDDYRDLASRVQDNLYLYYRRSSAQVPMVTASPIVDKPINIAMYSAKPIGDDPSRPVSKYAALPFRDDPGRSSSEYAARPYDREPPSALYSVRDYPRVTPPYSVRSQPPPRVIPGPVANTVPQGKLSQLSGQLWIKLPGKNWQELNTGFVLTTSGVVENRGSDRGSFRLDGRSTVNLEGHEIQTGWEIDRGSIVPDDLP